MEYILIVTAFIILVNQSIKINKIEKRLGRIQLNLDKIIKKHDLLPTSPEHPIHNELRKLIKEGEEEKAIKKAEETIGLSYQEAHHYIKTLKSEG